MKILAALVALGMLGMTAACAGAESTEDTIDETQEDLRARAGCSGKSEGDTCSVCGNRAGALKRCRSRPARSVRC